MPAPFCNNSSFMHYYPFASFFHFASKVFENLSDTHNEKKMKSDNEVNPWKEEAICV